MAVMFNCKLFFAVAQGPSRLSEAVVAPLATKLAQTPSQPVCVGWCQAHPLQSSPLGFLAHIQTKAADSEHICDTSQADLKKTVTAGMTAAFEPVQFKLVMHRVHQSRPETCSDKAVGDSQA
jgi:hypothetical protein